MKKIKKFIRKISRKYLIYRGIKKHLKGLVAELPKEIQEIILEYNTLYSRRITLEDILEDAMTNLYYEISEAYKKDWDRGRFLDLELEKLKQVNLK